MTNAINPIRPKPLSPKPLRLGVNIDHVATLRNARGGGHPDPIEAAQAAIDAGADGITVHLREDRRHIKDDDVARLMAVIPKPLNLEIAATDEMLGIALQHRPHAVCFVPERRQELTTEGGLDAIGTEGRLRPMIERLKAEGIRVTLFIEAEDAQIEAAASLGADCVELHTGAYCRATGEGREAALKRLAKGAELVAKLGMECHAGHGLTFDTVGGVAAIAEVVELNIGHFLIGAAITMGLKSAITTMRQAMGEGRLPVAPRAMGEGRLPDEGRGQ